jgi:hypothetical protein
VGGGSEPASNSKRERGWRALQLGTRPMEFKLAVAALPGTSGRHGRWLGGPARRGKEQRPLYRRRASFLVTGGRTGAPRGLAAGRHPSDRGSLCGGTATRSARRPRHARGPGEEAAWEGASSGGTRGGIEATARARPGVDAARRGSNVSDWQRLTEIFSKILNRSAHSGK